MATKKRMKRYDEGGEVGTGLKRETFGDAFKRNRASGEKTFEFGGKKYSTDVKGKADSGYKMDRSPMRTASQEFPTGANMEDMARRKRIEAEDKPLEESHPEDLVGGLGLKAAARGAKALAQAGERKAAQRATDSLAAANRREALKESAAKGTRAATREADDAADMSRMGSDFMKKGGKVKKMASGGSASKRADGCCIRGKTRA